MTTSGHKYTLVMDAESRAYQFDLRRRTPVAFSALIQALLRRAANDRAFEADVVRECGGAYYDDLIKQTAPGSDEVASVGLIDGVVEPEEADVIEGTEPEPLEAAEPPDSGFWTAD